MATLNLTYDTGSVTLADLNDMMALEYGYQATIPDPENPGQTIPNPESKAVFNRRQLGRMIIEAYRRQKRLEAERAAAEALPEIPDLG